MSLVPDPQNIRLALLGGTPGNGHPYSWSAIFNGYDRERMTAECPFPGIPDYLNQQPTEDLTIAGASVTHIHCAGEGEFTAEHVAACSLIPHVVDAPEDVIGEVDAIIIATDIGGEHVERARPFIEAGLPVFIDKPLTDNLADLRTFHAWIAEGRAIMSSSSMRYCREFLPFHESTADLGELRFASITTPKSWETYGIHALEAIYPILGPGFLSAQNTGTADRNVVHLTHERGVDVTVIANRDMLGGFGLLQLCGTQASIQTASADTFFAFKAQLSAFVDYLRTGRPDFPFAETTELMQLVIAGILSRGQGGRVIPLSELSLN